MLVLVWSGGVSWVGCLCSFFYDLLFLCLAWYGSQSEAAVNHCPWLRTIFRQPVFHPWVVGWLYVFCWVFVFCSRQNWFCSRCCFCSVFYDFIKRLDTLVLTFFHRQQPSQTYLQLRSANHDWWFVWWFSDGRLVCNCSLVNESQQGATLTSIDLAWSLIPHP